MLILETLKALGSMPLLPLTLALLLVVTASAGVGRGQAAPISTRLLSHVGFFAPVFAAAIAFLGQVGGDELGLASFVAGTARGAAAFLWAALAVGLGLVVVRVPAGKVGYRPGFGRLLTSAASLCVVCSGVLGGFYALDWLGELTGASWILLAVFVWICSRVWRRVSVVAGEAAGRPYDALGDLVLALSVGFAATAWEFLATASRTHVVGNEQILSGVASAVTTTLVWSGLGLLVVILGCSSKSASAAEPGRA